MKVTPLWLNTYFPFVSDLVTQGRIVGKQKISLTVKTGPVEIVPTHADGVVRHTSMGTINGARSFTHYAGTAESAANTPDELIQAGSPIEGRTINPGCYYAVLDVHNAYGFRGLTLWLSESDLAQASTELRNVLTPLNLPLLAFSHT